MVLVVVIMKRNKDALIPHDDELIDEIVLFEQVSEIID